MDKRLFQAVLNGDVDNLLREVEANPTMLHAAALEGGENPLHIACLAGHLNFAATVVKLRPQFSWELNQDGFSPLHIAASCGHIEIVKELLQVNPDLCLLQGKNRKIPLHLAVAKGNVEVTKLLLSRLESIDCTTAQGETSLHLALKYNQFEVFHVLIQYLKQVDKEDLLNCKDINGNTILHLAVCKKQYQVVDHILNGGVISKEKLELNSLNKSGLTPLDMLLMFQSEAGDREIHEILIQTGALKAGNLQSPAHTQEKRSNLHVTRHQHPGFHPRKLLNYFRFNSLRDSPSKVRNTLLVIAILVTTATYQPVLSTPGGTWQDDYVPSTLNTSSSSATTNITTATKPHTAGQPIMLTHRPIVYNAFILVNSLGFYTSIHMIVMLTISFPMRFELGIVLIALITSYSFGIIGVIPADQTGTRIVSFFLGLMSTIPMTTLWLRDRPERPRNASANRGQERV
ncbi:hypothetical protein L1987_00893 [Smallanthus sonchifolius]|uniref:Uncharacterized protein n=1 Tax=Smallanthus sonchifolius TaxID=185202 RepID=A0ACB9K3S8_9ASTR|nr:hypothetical protein L1987_00893 [Smallanthus sonchifolius]